VLDICYLTTKRELDDVRWEKIEQVKRILANGTYSAPLEQVAAKLIEDMLEPGHDDQA
jgi:anti-sigma28 factor (negative regulator of flagellin synthesis)